MSRHLTMSIAAAVIAGLVAVAAPAGAQEGPSIVVSPATDIVDGDTVQVELSGYPVNASLGVAQCLEGSTDISSCDVSVALFTTADAEGSSTVSFQAARIITVAGSEVDCFSTACVMGAAIVNLSGPGPITSEPVYAPITFAPVFGPTVGVTPAVGLVDGQEVAVSAAGYPVDSSLVVAQCLPGAGALAQCDPVIRTTVTSDGDGQATTAFTVSRSLTDATDCLDADCTLGVATTDGGSFRSMTIEFAPVMEVTPSTGLVDGQTVTVAVAGLEPFSGVGLAQCGVNATISFGCDDRTIVSTAPTDGVGRVTATFTLSRVIYAPGRTDCSTSACTVTVLDSGGPVVSAPLEFAAGPPLPPEVVRIDIEPVGTVRADGHRRSVMQAVASCDIAVRLDVYRVLEQTAPAPGTTSSQFGAVACAPDEEVLVFSSFDPGFVVGPARMSVSVSAVAGGVEVARTGDAADVALVDEAAVREVVAGLLADPANAELREQVLRAIKAQVAQDPLFRQEFFAAIING